MGFSLSMLPRRQPYPAQVNQQQAHLDYQYRKAHRELVADRNRLNEISEDNGRLSRQVEDLKRQHLLDSERIQRQHELLSKACEEVTSRNEDHQRELSNLYAKLNALQSTESLTDEQILGEMRRLSQHLESWIKSNFKDGEKLAARFHNADGFHRSSPQRRAWIQAHITDLVQRHIFAASRFGLPNNPWGQLITEIEAGVQRSTTTFVNWRVATGVAVEAIGKPHHPGTFTAIIDEIENYYAMASSTEGGTRRRQLLQFLERCSTLKSVLDKQQDFFVFHCSSHQTEINLQSMSIFASDGEAPARVRLTLWPAIMKGSPSTRYTVLEPELIWAMD